jgi:hypothetical protein
LLESERFFSELALQSQFNEQQDQKDQKSLSQLKSIMKIDVNCRHVDIPAYKRLLDYTFTDLELETEQDCRMTWEVFTREPVIRYWLNHAGSSMVILAGNNSDTINNSTLTWISHGSILAIEEFMRDKAMVAYYFCQTSGIGTPTSRVTIQDIGASIVYQLASQVPSMLRSGIEDIRQCVQSPEWSSGLEEDAMKPVRHMIERILSSLDHGTKVVLIIDRLDQCLVGLRVLVRWLLKILRKTTCVLKVLVVSHPQAPGGYMIEREKSQYADIYLEKLDWNQIDNI